MTTYKTKAFNVGDLTVTVSKAGKSAAERIVAFLEALADKIVDPDYGIDQGGRPDQGLPPGQGHPDQGLPGSGGRPDQGLPPAAGRPDQGLPGSQPGVDNELPGAKLADFLKEHADEIAKAILKGTLCDPDKEPK